MVQRGKLLRSRFKATGGVAFAGKGMQAPKAKPIPRGRVYMPWPDIIVDNKRTPQWAMRPQPTLQRALEPRRMARVSPLIRIAEHYPRRLQQVG